MPSFHPCDPCIWVFQKCAAPRHRRNSWLLQAAVEAAVADNVRVLALAGAAEHVAAGAPLFHPGLRDDALLTVSIYRRPAFFLEISILLKIPAVLCMCATTVSVFQVLTLYGALY